MTTTIDRPPQVTTLHMVRAEVDMREFQRWMGTRRLQDPDHAMHCYLTECFGKVCVNEPRNVNDVMAVKPFRLIIPRGGRTGCLYGYSGLDADELRERMSMYADPLQTRITPSSTMDTKPMPVQWSDGLCLGFDVRIRPVVRLLHDVPQGSQEMRRAGKECDAFLREAIQHPRKVEMHRSREEVYRDWLSAQLSRRGGATLVVERTKLVSFQRTRAARNLHSRSSEGPDAVMRGVLAVTDSDEFNALLAQGVGRHRAYGYGMLLLRPVSG